MAVKLPAPPYKAPAIDEKGYLSQQWIGWFRDMFLRIGGTDAPSNAELGADTSNLGPRVTSAESQIATLQLNVTANTTSITTLRDDFGQGRVL